MLRVGVIGLGVGKQHIKAWNSHPECEVVAVCDKNYDVLHPVMKKLEIKGTTDADDILQSNDIDVVSIASWDEYHYIQTISFLQRGKHIFVEKPLCSNRHELYMLRWMFSVAQGWGFNSPPHELSSNMVLRTCPLFIDLKEKYEAGEFGEVYHIEADYLWGRPEKLLSGWRHDMTRYSIILGGAVHMIDLVMWITGAEPEKVRCISHNKALKTEHDDFAVIIMQFPDGMTAKVTVHGGYPGEHIHEMEVYGTKRDWFSQVERVEMSNCCVGYDERIYPAKQERRRVIHSFADHILHGTDPIVPAQDVFNVMDVCFRAMEDARE